MCNHIKTEDIKLIFFKLQQINKYLNTRNKKNHKLAMKVPKIRNVNFVVNKRF